MFWGLLPFNVVIPQYAIYQDNEDFHLTKLRLRHIRTASPNRSFTRTPADLSDTGIVRTISPRSLIQKLLKVIESGRR